MADRYFVETPIATDPIEPGIELGGAEAHHLIHVMRAKAAPKSLLFDGRGAEFLARVERVHRTAVELSIVERRAIDRELPLVVTLGVALPKGDRQRWLIKKRWSWGRPGWCRWSPSGAWPNRWPEPWCASGVR